MTQPNKTFVFANKQRTFTFAEPPSIANTISQRVGNTTVVTAEQMEKTARQWQSKAFSKWIGLGKNPRGTLKAGTGAGKTRFAVMAIMNWLHEKEHGTAVFVVPSRTLGTQTKNALRALGLSCARYWSDFKEKMPNKDVYITTYTSLPSMLDAVPYLKNRDVLLVLDECHKAGAKQALKNVTSYKGDACLMLSATPHRSDGVDVPLLMEAPIFFELSLIEGIRQSRTAEDALDYTFHVVFVDMNQDEQIEYEEYCENITKLWFVLQKEGKECGANTNNLFHRMNEGIQAQPFKRTLRIWKNLLLKRKRLINEMEIRYSVSQQIMELEYGKKYMLFNQSIFAIERLNGMMKDMGIHPRIYHSGLQSVPDNVFEMYPELNNEGFIRRFNEAGSKSDAELKRWVRSASDILLCCKSLTEGFDCPSLDGLIMANGTNTLTQRIQTIGRVFRGEKHKDIWMLVHNDESSGENKALYELIHEVGIEHHKIRYHFNGITTSHITVPQDTEMIN